MSFICFDTEDNSPDLMKAGKSGFDKKVTQIAAIKADGVDYYSRGNVNDFLKWLEKQDEKYIYAHNLQYDLGNLFADKLDCLDIILVGGRMIRASWRNKIFLDTFNIWPMSVKKLAPAFGLKKGELDTTSRDYVFNDVEVIRQAMLFAWQFAEICGIPKLPATLGGFCVKLWKHWGGQNVHDSSKLSRLALFGGRVELFKKISDSDNVGYTDITSLYPFVMQKKFPAQLEPCADFKEFGISTVTVEVKKSSLVVLPFRELESERILYPYGKFTGTWTNEEIKFAEANGAKVIRLHTSLGTNEFIEPYADFVRKLFTARKATINEAEKLFFKLLMNNLYGRLGVSGKITRSVYQTDKNQNQGVPYGEKVLVNYKMPLADETNWSHAAYVTSYGRMELFKYLKTIGTEKLIYCDTDSAIFDCPEKKFPFETGNELGQMKIEKCGEEMFWPHCETFSPKCYNVGAQWKAKGVPQRLAKEFIQSGSASFDLPFKVREAIRFFDKGNTKQLSVWRNVSKQKQTDYDKKTYKNNRYFPCRVWQ